VVAAFRLDAVGRRMWYLAVAAALACAHASARLLWFVVYAAVLVTGLQAYNRYRLRGWPSPGFPKTLPILGNVVSAGPAFMRYLGREAKQHGGLFLFWPGGSAPIAVVASPRGAREVLGNGVLFPKGADYEEKFGVVFGKGLVTSTGADHSAARRCLGRYFVKTNLEQHGDVMRQECEKMADEVFEPKLANADADGFVEMDLQEFFHLCTLQIFCRVQLSIDMMEFGTAKGHPAPPVSAAKSNARGDWAHWIAMSMSWGSNVIGEHMLYNIPLLRCVPRVPRLLATKKQLDAAAFLPMIEERRKLVAHGNAPEDCLTALITADAPAFSDQAICDQLTTLIAAGHDTTAYFCCYAAMLLAKEPKWQDTVRNELARPAFDWPASALKRVVQETLRLYPVIPMVIRVAAQDAVISNTDETKLAVPRGTRLLVPFFCLNRLPETWGPNAAKFDPDRWLEAEGAPRSDGVMRAPAGFLPFGYGSRTCIGYALALLELKVIFAVLLRRYEFAPVPGFSPTILAGISLTVENPKGIKIRVKRRA